MINIVKNDNKYVQMCMLGDIHGDFSIIRDNVLKHDLMDSIIFQVGDFGIGFQPSKDKIKMEKLNVFLSARNCFLYAIRGNHDDPKIFDGKKLFSNILFIEDWSILEVNINGQDERIFCLGGAISIDRKFRIDEGLGYWPDEVVVFQNDSLEDVRNVTMIVTHTSPEYAEPYYFNEIVYRYAASDSSLLEDLRKERRELSYIFERILENNKDTLRIHYYGHFHFSATNEYKGVILKLLSINELCLSS